MHEISHRNKPHPDHRNLAGLDVNTTLNEYTEKLRNRLPRAYDLGWSIHHDHFVCNKNCWAASYQCVYVPHWFWDESVLTTGQ